MKFSWQHGIGIALVIILGGIIFRYNKNEPDKKIKKTAYDGPFFDNIDRKLIDINSSGETLFISSTGNRYSKSILNNLIQDIMKDSIEVEEVEKRCLQLPQQLADGSEFRAPIRRELATMAGRLREKKRAQ